MQYKRRSEEERIKILQTYKELRAQKISMKKAAAQLGISKGTLNDWWSKYKNHTPSVTIHAPVKRKYTKKAQVTPQTSSSNKCFIIVTDTTSIRDVLRQL